MTDDDPIDPRVRDYIAGRLSAEDEAALLAEAERSSALKADLRLASSLRAVSETDVPETEFGWARLSRAIETETKAGPVNDNFPRFLRTQRFSALQTAGLAAVAVLIWQIAAVPMQNGSGPEAQFVPVSEQQVEHVLTVAFTPDAKIDDVTRLLQAISGEIIAGPSALGLYRVRFDDAEASARGAELLNARTDLIESVTGY